MKKVCDMKKEIIRFFKMWTLPLGMLAGVGIYLMFHYIPLLSPLKVLAKGAEDFILPLMVFIQLFTTFCKVNPLEMRIRWWHLIMVAVQLGCSLAIALPVHFLPESGYSVAAQGALVCLIVPTGTAAAVIAGRLGGNETTLTTYTMISNLVAAVAIPAVFPLVEMQSAGTFAHQFRSSCGACSRCSSHRSWPRGRSGSSCRGRTPRSCGCVGASLSTCGAFRW